MKSWNYADIAIFLAVVEENSFTAAAQKIGLPKSTVSRRVAQLEDALKIRLLERSTRKIALTETGKRLFLDNKQIFHQIDQNLSQLIDNKDEMSGIIKITAPTLIADTLLNKFLIQFQEIHPNIDFYLHTSNQIQDLLTDEFDLAIRMGPLTNSEYICQKLWSPEMVLCATPNFLAQHSINTPEDLAQTKYMLNNYTNEHFIFRHKTTNDIAKLTIHGKLFSNNKPYTLQATLANKGVSAMPKYYIQHLLDKGELTQAMPEYELQFEAELFAVYPSKRHLSQKINQLITFLKQEFAKID